jgi:hypothetical protein
MLAQSVRESRRRTPNPLPPDARLVKGPETGPHAPTPAAGEKVVEEMISPDLAYIFATPVAADNGDLEWGFIPFESNGTSPIGEDRDSPAGEVDISAPALAPDVERPSALDATTAPSAGDDPPPYFASVHHLLATLRYDQSAGIGHVHAAVISRVLPLSEHWRHRQNYITEDAFGLVLSTSGLPCFWFLLRNFATNEQIDGACIICGRCVSNCGHDKGVDEASFLDRLMSGAYGHCYYRPRVAAVEVSTVVKNGVEFKKGNMLVSVEFPLLTLTVLNDFLQRMNGRFLMDKLCYWEAGGALSLDMVHQHYRHSMGQDERRNLSQGLPIAPLHFDAPQDPRLCKYNPVFDEYGNAVAATRRGRW